MNYTCFLEIDKNCIDKNDLRPFDYLKKQYDENSSLEDNKKPFVFDFSASYETQDKILYSGTLNFKSFSGITFIDVVYKDQEYLPKFPIDVRSKKINYQEQYPQMIADIAEYLSGLLFRMDSPLYHSYELNEPSSNSPYEDYMLLEYLFRPDNLPAIFEYLSRNLYSYLEEFTERVPTTFASNIGANELANIAAYTDSVKETQNEEESVFCVDGTHYIPLEIDEIEHRDIIDVPENRFFKYFLEYVEEMIYNLLEYDEIKRMDPSQHIKGNLLSFKNDIEYFLSQKFFNDVSTLDYLPLNSQVLQKKEGYREILEYFLMLELGLKINCDIITDEFKGFEKRLSRLYEYWCYFKLVNVIENVTQSNFSLNDFMDENNDFVLKLNANLSKSFIKNEKLIELRLEYQPTFISSDSGTNSIYRSESLEFEPDYTLFIKMGDEEKFVHFDAKYKVHRNGRYKNEDIWKMHTYNDAIKDSLGSYILYPGSFPPALFPSERKAIVGAFPLNPEPNSNEINEIINLVNKKIDDFFIIHFWQLQQHH